MQMLNRAIEDAADFQDMLKRITEQQREHTWDVQEAKTARQPGENREQHRARLKAERKARA